MAKSKSKSASGSKSKGVAKPAAPAAKAKAKAPAAKPAPAKAKAKAPAAKPAASKGTKPAAVARTVGEIAAASEAAPYQLVVRGSAGTTTYADGADELVVGPPTLFACTLTAATVRRYLHLLQKDAASGHVVLLHVLDGSGATRIPAAPGWQRAIVEGTIHLIASDLLLSREDIVALIGGHEPPPSDATPPFI